MAALTRFKESVRLVSSPIKEKRPAITANESPPRSVAHSPLGSDEDEAKAGRLIVQPLQPFATEDHVWWYQFSTGEQHIPMPSCSRTVLSPPSQADEVGRFDPLAYSRELVKDRCRSRSRGLFEFRSARRCSGSWR
jgi:hypothetical protein